MAGRPTVEPMNVTSNHPKLRTTLRFADPSYIAGDAVSGKMEVECKAEKGLAVGAIMVELFGIEELTSRDHSARQTFLHSERIFQGPGLPPSNSVHPYPPSGEALLPHHFYYARRGTTTFWFRLPLPPSSPSSINFGSGLAQVRYEVRATVEVIWKGQKQLVTDKKAVEVIESYDRGQDGGHSEGIVVSENGQLWVQGSLRGGVIVPGEPACVDLVVKNHSAKKNSGLTVSLTRELILPGMPPTQRQPLQISDTLASVSFRGPEYIIQQGVEGVARLVFDVPSTARSVTGGRREGGDQATSISALFEVRCLVTAKLVMGVGSKDIQLDLPARICHPDTIPEDVFAEPETFPLDSYSIPGAGVEAYTSPFTAAAYLPPVSPTPYLHSVSPLHQFIAPPISPSMSPLPFIDQGQVWIPPPPIHSPLQYQYTTPPPQNQYPYLPPPADLMSSHISHPRPYSAQPKPSSPFYVETTGLPPPSAAQPVVPLSWMTGTQQTPGRTPEREEGKGERAARISHHLRVSSRYRSVSPQGHRYALPDPNYVDDHGGNIGQFLRGYVSPQASHAPASPNHISPRISPSISSVSGDVASPRPGFSPGHTFSADPVTHATLSKSDCVEALELIAAHTNEENADMSGSVPDFSPNQGKTLPGPPVPSSKTKPMFLDVRPRADMIFEPHDHELDVAPPTPTLAAVASPKALRSAQGSSGLDALEARLLAEVGTRKVNQEGTKPDVRSVLPIPIPRPADVIDLPVDSAISSLSLPSLGANEGTLRLGTGSRPSSSGSHRGRPSKRTKDIPVDPVPPKTRERRPLKEKVEDMKEKEHHRLRKMAQGRVTAWLGGIDPDAPPQTATPPSNTIALPVETSLPLARGPEKCTTIDPPTDSEPNPRSSGFMPLGAMKTGKRIPSTKVDTATPSVESQRELPRRAVIPPRLTDPEVRYDVRSARGGRGGKVTAVAAIWASAAQTNDPPSAVTSNRATPRPVSHPLKLAPAQKRAAAVEKSNARLPKQRPVNTTPPAAEVPTKRAKMVKAMSVPAVISSSLATPVLSSTASLARPPRSGDRTRVETLSSPGIESRVLPQSQPTSFPSPKAELAFGQARLRELIKKYQG